MPIIWYSQRGLFMLHERCISKKLLILLRKLENESVFKDYFLVGGTALALQIEPVYHENQIAYLGKKDIAAMKLHAIETSGDRAKDFIDIYYLLKEIPLEKMFASYQKKYSTENIFNAKRSLCFFEDVHDESWTEVRLIDKKLTASLVKASIINAIKDYNN